MLVDRMVEDVQKLGLDGIDLAQRNGEGVFLSESSLQLYFLKQLRKALPDKVRKNLSFLFISRSN